MSALQGEIAQAKSHAATLASELTVEKEAHTGELEAPARRSTAPRASRRA